MWKKWQQQIYKNSLLPDLQKRFPRGFYIVFKCSDNAKNKNQQLFKMLETV